MSKIGGDICIVKMIHEFIIVKELNQLMFQIKKWR